MSVRSDDSHRAVKGAKPRYISSTKCVNTTRDSNTSHGANITNDEDIDKPSPVNELSPSSLRTLSITSDTQHALRSYLREPFSPHELLALGPHNWAGIRSEQRHESEMRKKIQKLGLQRLGLEQ
jgi:hypothetical protein